MEMSLSFSQLDPLIHQASVILQRNVCCRYERCYVIIDTVLCLPLTSGIHTVVRNIVPFKRSCVCVTYTCVIMYDVVL